MSALPPPESKAAAVQRMFDDIAPRYDLMNRLMTGRLDQRWRRQLVERLGIGPGDTVLDLACGTGDFALLAGERGARVIGLDFARQMLLRGVDRDLPGTDLVQGDALNLPLATDSIDVVVSGFALRNFTSIPPVVAELARVLRPGARLGFLEVDEPSNPVVRAGHGLYFNRVVPFMGRMLSRQEAYRYLPQSVVYLPSSRELAQMLKDAGFSDIRKRRHGMGAAQSLTAVHA